MNRRSRLCLCLLLFGMVSCSSRENLTESDDLGPILDFICKERDGRTISSKDDLRDKVWVASFIFTRCTSGCPQVTATMGRLQKDLRLADSDDLRFVTFTVDPKRDDLTDLKQYADHCKAHPTRWLFLTCGDQDEMHQLIQKGFKLPVAERPEDKKKPGDEFDHATRLVVIDARGHIRGYFEGMPRSHKEEDQRDFEANLVKLKKRVSALRKGS